MSLPTMSVINFSSKLSDAEVQTAIRAVNRQILEDFAPIWGAAYSLRLHASDVDPIDEGTLTEEFVRGESVMYLVDNSTVPGALGYHDLNTKAIPVGFVFVLDADDWTTTLSHEVLELIIDPTVNILVPGPDPRNPANVVLHTYEVCDAVERTSYFIDGIEVSNFITQSWFTPGEELGTRNDFLGVGVNSFDSTLNSHLAFYDLAANEWVTYFGTAAPVIHMAAERAKACYHEPKLARPDAEIQSALDVFKASKKKAGVKTLPYLHGLTRSARYMARAGTWFGKDKIKIVREDMKAAG